MTSFRPQAAPPRRRFFSARRRLPTLAAILSALLVATLAGCASPGGDRAGNSPADTTAGSDWQPSLNRVVGRVYSVDLSLSYVVIDLSPYAEAQPSTGSIIITRRDDLTPTARLQVTAFRRGRTLGAQIIAGQPVPGDEVVLPNP